MYLIIFFAGTISSLFKDKKNRLFLLFAVILGLLAFFRYGVGADYFSYQYLYERLRPSVIDEIRNGLDNNEILFRIIGSFLKSLGFTYQMYLVVFATVNLFFVYKICRQHSQNPMLSLFLYYAFFYFVWTFSGLRQGVTLVIGIYYLIQCLEKKKPVKLIVISLILSLIHMSAIILIAFYIANKIHLNRKILMVTSLLSVLVSALPLGRLLGPLTALPFLNKLIPYFSVDYSLANAFNFQSIARIVFLAVGLLYYNDYIKQGGIHKILMNTYILGLNVYFIFKFSELTAARLSIYGFFLVIIILPNIFTLYKKKFNKIVFATLLYLLISLYFYKELGAMGSSVGYTDNRSIFLPYTNIYNQEQYVFDNIYKSATDSDQ